MSPGSPTTGTCPEHLPKEASRGIPIQIPEPPHVAPLDVEQRLSRWMGGWMGTFLNEIKPNVHTRKALGMGSHMGGGPCSGGGAMSNPPKNTSMNEKVNQ